MSVPLTHRLKCEAVAKCFPPEAVITGRSAAALHGIDLATAATPVEVIVSGEPYVNRRRATRCWSVRTRPFEHRPWEGTRCATVHRACLDLLARHPLTTSVPAVDAFLHAGLTDEPQLRAFLSGRSEHRIRKARAAFEYVDGRAESPPESVVRVLLALGGLTPEPQVGVWSGGSFLARVDLAFRESEVAVEYDGAWHGDPEQVRADEVRRARLRAAGWNVVVVTQTRLHDDPDGLVDEVRGLLRRRSG